MYPTRFVPFFCLPSHSALLSTSSVPSTFHICCTPTLCVTPTLSLLSPVPACPHVTPIAVSPVCFVTARQSIFFTDQAEYQNSAELLWRMGVFFRSGSVSVCEVTYSDKAPGGGVAATAQWQWGQTHGVEGWGGARRGQALKRPCLF